MKKFMLLIAGCMLIATSPVIKAQSSNSLINRHTQASSHHNVGNGYGILGQSFLAQNVCGLNYVYASQLTETRTQSLSYNTNGTGLPA
ncbi:MAG TPA: hypothetical protein VK808_12985, partial [Bacteroidia bacterium]|nr:hypothetical protein [Bacteroidia bacterium]